MLKETKNNSIDDLAFSIADKIMEENYQGVDIHNENYGRIYLDIYMNVLIQLNNLNELKDKRITRI